VAVIAAGRASDAVHDALLEEGVVLYKSA